MILLIDNYDSFVFNLQRYLRRLGQQTVVVRSDAVSLPQIAGGEYAAIVISPGPKAPEQAGRSLEVIDRFHTQVPMLGVCLGHQAICQAFGGTIVRAPRAVHGQSSLISHSDSRLFDGLPNPFAAARYHSLIADHKSLPADLRVTGLTARDPVRGAAHAPLAAADDESIVMAVEHIRWPVFGVQFHPESILSEVGYRILANFLVLAGLETVSSLPPSDFASDTVRDHFQRAHGLSDQRLTSEGQAAWPPAVLPQSLRRDSVPPEQPTL